MNTIISYHLMRWFRQSTFSNIYYYQNAVEINILNQPNILWLCILLFGHIQSVLPKTGDYIIPIENEDGSIGYNCIQTPSFEQYMLSVGKVIKILSETQVMVLIKTC